MCEPYQGWANHATWCVALHLSNTKELYDLCRVAAKIHDSDRKKAMEVADIMSKRFDTDTVARYAEMDADDRFRDFVKEELFAPVYDRHNAMDLLAQDLLTSTLDDVDWTAVRASFVED